MLEKLNNVVLCGTCGSQMIPVSKILEMYHKSLQENDKIFTHEKVVSFKLNEDLIQSLNEKLERARKEFDGMELWEQQYLNPPEASKHE